MKPTQASSTAKVIAASTLLLFSQKATRHLVPVEATSLCEQFLSTCTADRLLAWSARNPLTRIFWRTMERLTHPGIVQHFWHRKRWIEEVCSNAIDDGYERLLIVGAGFDTLGIRCLTRYPSLTVVELDHPATQSVKRAALQASPAPPTGITWMAVDLSVQPFPVDDLHSPKRTIVVLEGLLMYLPQQAVLELLGNLTHISSQPVRIVLSYMQAWPDGSIGFRPRSALISLWLRFTSEPFQWAITPADVAAFLVPAGLHVLRHVDCRSLSVSAQNPQGTGLDGENVLLCESRPGSKQT